MPSLRSRHFGCASCQTDGAMGGSHSDATPTNALKWRDLSQINRSAQVPREFITFAQLIYGFIVKLHSSWLAWSAAALDNVCRACQCRLRLISAAGCGLPRKGFSCGEVTRRREYDRGCRGDFGAHAPTSWADGRYREIGDNVFPWPITSLTAHKHLGPGTGEAAPPLGTALRVRARTGSASEPPHHHHPAILGSACCGTTTTKLRWGSLELFQCRAAPRSRAKQR